MTKKFKKPNDKILLIEHDQEVAATLKEWLSPIVLTQVSSREDILGALHAGPWDLIITDVALPNLNDVDVTRLAKEIDPTTAILIVTQHQKINFILDALKNHADALQFKPLDKREFLDVCQNLLKEVHERRQKEKNIVLAIGAHPDDVEVGCGGALAKHYNNGDIIHILTLSLGEKGGNPQIRKKEAMRAARMQGANLHFGHLSDTQISAGTETVSVIEKVIDKVTPNLIYSHSMHDNHNDHRNVHYATLSASRSVSNLYCYQSPSSTVHFLPNLFIELSHYELEKKIKSIMTFKSQYDIRPYLYEKLIRTNAYYWSRFCNYQLAEPMEVIKQWSI